MVSLTLLGSGIIPAYAGSTPPSPASESESADHPRIRGEHLKRLLDAVGFGGSSPHTRGAPRSTGRHTRRRGIIPAYAGSTVSSFGNFHSERIIPAYAGSTLPGSRRRAARSGSSPHTRGALPVYSLAVVGVRIIPAYAGSTSCLHGAAATLADHPRIRGEHVMPSRNVNGVTGSSPHTRGALAEGNDDCFTSRIIPAYAGSTSCPAPSGGRGQDHPRIRGEHQILAISGNALEGSSPHTRGARGAR